MKVSKFNKEKLNEVLRRKYLNELIDFCLYENCLQEETAREYFDWLIDKIENDGDYAKIGGKTEKEILQTSALDRWNEEKRQMRNQIENGVIINYFGDNQSFNDFVSDFEKELKRGIDNRTIEKRDLPKIRACFDYYCNLFSYREKASRSSNWAEPRPYFSKKVTWKGKDSEYDRKHKIMHRWNPQKHTWIETDPWKQKDYYQTVEDNLNNPDSPENKIAI